MRSALSTITIVSFYYPPLLTVITSKTKSFCISFLHIVIVPWISNKIDCYPWYILRLCMFIAVEREIEREKKKILTKPCLCSICQRIAYFTIIAFEFVVFFSIAVEVRKTTQQSLYKWLISFGIFSLSNNDRFIVCENYNRIFF